MVVTKGLERQLRIYTKEEFEKRSRKILDYPSLDPEVQRFRNYWFGSAEYITPDQQGRFVLPEALRQFIAAAAGGEVALVGSYEFVEVYNADEWKKQREALDAAISLDGAKMFAKFGI